MLAGSVGAAFLGAGPVHAESLWDRIFSGYQTTVSAPQSDATTISAYQPARQIPQPVDWRNAMAADIPTKAPPLDQWSTQAVDGLNGKADAWGGELAKRSFWGTKGSMSVPLAASYGLQIDGAVGKFDNRTFGAVAGHAFWRDPRVGLVGLYGSYYNWDSIAGQVHLGQIAGEASWYWNRVTIEGIAGVEFGNHVTNVTNGIINDIDIKTRFFDKVNLGYYVTDNINVFIGHRYLGGKNAAALGGEWGVPIPRSTVMASAFVEGRLGDYTGVWGGLRFYIGQKNKSLMRRHREDDPIEWAPEGLGTMSNQQTGTPVPPSGPPKPPPES